EFRRVLFRSWDARRVCFPHQAGTIIVQAGSSNAAASKSIWRNTDAPDEEQRLTRRKFPPVSLQATTATGRSQQDFRDKNSRTIPKFSGQDYLTLARRCDKSQGRSC